MLSDYVAQFMPQNLRDLLLEFLTQLWFARLLKMKQKTIGNQKIEGIAKVYLMCAEHERMSAGDPTHDHAICGGTTSLAEAQRQMALIAEIFTISMTNKTKHVRLGFANARSGTVDFTKPMKILTER